jgi:hypothetical protein
MEEKLLKMEPMPQMETFFISKFIFKQDKNKDKLNIWFIAHL